MKLIKTMIDTSAIQTKNAYFKTPETTPLYFAPMMNYTRNTWESRPKYPAPGRQSPLHHIRIKYPSLTSASH
jgi:hypothetical protein